jgi:hypothetical protein
MSVLPAIPGLSFADAWAVGWYRALGAVEWASFMSEQVGEGPLEEELALRILKALSHAFPSLEVRRSRALVPRHAPAADRLHPNPHAAAA